MSQHLILLGDSILDNAAYVPGRPAVIDQVRNRLPENWKASLLAQDGSVIDDVHRQLKRIPADASHLILSAGGNDLLCEIGILRQSTATVGEGLRLLADTIRRAEQDYHRLTDAMAALELPIVLCAVYNPRLPDDELQQEAVAALSLLNDRIIAVGRRLKFPVIDLRAVCTEIADFANEIEPSLAGGAKIAQAICDACTTHDFESRRSVLLP